MSKIGPFLQFKSEDDLEDDRVGLLRDAEEASGAESLKMSSLSPPSYVGQSEALEYQMNRAAKKVQILDEMHKAYLRRPAFDETTEDEEKIDAMTREVTQVRRKYKRTTKRLAIPYFCLDLLISDDRELSPTN